MSTPRRLNLRPVLGTAVGYALAVGAYAVLVGLALPPASFVDGPAPPPAAPAALDTRAELAPLAALNVGAEAPGRVQRVDVKPGDRVTRGQELLRFDDRGARIGVRDAEAARDALRAQRDAQAATLRRAERKREAAHARATHAATASDRQAAADTDADTDAAIAAAHGRELAARLREADARLARARLALAQTRVTAPVGGTVVAVDVQAGETVSPQSRPALLRIARLDTMRGAADIPESVLPAVRPGQAVTLTVPDDSGDELRGEVLSVDPLPGRADGGVTHYRAWFDVPNEDGRLHIGMHAPVRIAVPALAGAIDAPAAGGETTTAMGR